jgi:hypothetical protein
MFLRTALLWYNNIKNNFLYQTIEIWAGIRIGDVGQPNILVPLITALNVKPKEFLSYSFKPYPIKFIKIVLCTKHYLNF